MMKVAGMNGWAVLAERLRLEKDDPWWEDHFRFDGTLPSHKHDRVVPLRKVWRNIEDYPHHPQLGHAPWTRNMTQSKPAVIVSRSW